ncbi:MAG: 30S ribosomal protein S6 [bacterium]
MNTYETMFILKSPIEDEDKEKVLTGIRNIIFSAQGEVKTLDSWGSKKLAYPVKRETKGEYYLLNFLAPPKTIKGMSQYLKLNDYVLKYMTTKKEVAKSGSPGEKKTQEVEEELKEASK